MREVIAKAIADCIQGRESWHDNEPAQAALDAISEAGFVIVPKEPTEKMVAQGGFYDLVSFSDWEAKDQVRSLYRAMIEASQETNDG